MKRHRLLVKRDFFGLGDWIMFQSVIKTVNRLYPDLAIDLDISKTPEFFQILTLCFDAHISMGYHLNPSDYQYFDPHVVYPQMQPKNEFGDKIHFIEGMLGNLAKKTGLTLPWDGTLSKFMAPKTPVSLPKEYVVFSSGCAKNPFKDWSFEKFSELAKILRPEIPIVQVGLSGDKLIPGAVYALNLKPAQLSFVLSNAKATVCLENGINHFCGHLGVKTCTLYVSPDFGTPLSCGYPNQTPLCGKEVTPSDVNLVIRSLIEASFQTTLV